MFPVDPLAVKIEFAFGADLKADPATWVWVDRTADWLTSKDLAATIGRADAANKPPPAKLSFWLKNGGGRYTKGNPLSPHWPFIRKNTPVRVTIDPGTGHSRVYTMYVTQWLPRWGSDGASGRQPLVQVVANGVRRRLTQGDSPLRSPLYRAITASKPVAYWPLEDGSDATQAASALAGGQPMTLTHGKVDFAATDGPAGSTAVVDLSAGGTLTGVVPAGSSSTSWRLELVTKFVAFNPGTFAATAQWLTEGGVGLWEIDAAPQGDGGLSLQYITANGAFGGPFVSNVKVDDGEWHHVRVDASQSGGNISLTVKLDGVTVITQTLTGLTMGRVTVATLNPTNDITEGVPSAGHLAVWAPWGGANVDTAAAARGYAGERAGDRIARLCAEEGVAAVVPAPVALVTEGFETATPAATITGTWARTSAQSHTGTWALKSATIGNSASTDAVVTVPVGATAMTVWYKVSSEAGFDFLRILRDGAQESQFSGEVGWTQRTIDVTGVKQVTFRYVKDSSTVAGSDAAWIDDLVFSGSPTALMGPQRPDALVALLDECQEVDGGTLLDGLNPGWTYLPRVAAYNLPVALTIDMAGHQFKAPFEPRDDDAGVVNDETVSRVNGSSARFVDDDSVAAIERYDDETTLNVYGDADLAAQAAWRTHLGTAAADALRFPGVGFDLHTAAGVALIEPWLQSGIRTRQQVTHPPAEYGPGPIDLLVEGYTETVKSRRVWTVAANASQYAHDVFVVGADRVDGDGYQLAAGVSATATTLQVASTTGLLWITTAADPTAFPFDLDIAGIRVRVTGISGSGSPQTFTVTRSTDGFDKPLPVNSPVRLWKPAVIGL